MYAGLEECEPERRDVRRTGGMCAGPEECAPDRGETGDGTVSRGPECDPVRGTAGRNVIRLGGRMGP